MRYKLLIAYDGTNYSGWQIQPTGLSIQECLEKALTILLKSPIRVVGSGRTDAGVHANGQVAHFDVKEKIDCFWLLKSLNGILPTDIRVKNLCQISEEFHARFSAKGKIYHYHLWFGQTVDPFYRLYRAHLRESLDLDHLRQSACYFLGKKEFASFANVGSSVKTTVRTLHRIEVVEQEGGVRIEFEGDGFLYKMVRNITATMIEMAKGKCSFERLQTIFEAKDRKVAPASAPARGLFLEKVIYEDPLFGESS